MSSSFALDSLNTLHPIPSGLTDHCFSGMAELTWDALTQAWLVECLI